MFSVIDSTIIDYWSFELNIEVNTIGTTKA